MRNRKGFTLIELLAVIVILAIIALIAIPQVMKILNQARISAAEDTTYGIYNATQDYVSRVMLDNGGDFPGGELTFTCDSTSCKLDNYASLATEGFSLEETLDYKGAKVKGGKIKISNNGTDIVIENLKVNEFTCGYSNEKASCERGGSSSNGGQVADPVSFENDDWSTIIAAVENNNISNYHVGDIKTVEMDVNGDGTKETYTLRIANTTTPAECSTAGFSQTACGFVLEFVDIVAKHQMNPTNTNKGGWKSSKMRSYVNNDIYSLLPTEIKNAIIDTTVVSGHGKNDSNNFTTTDKLYLLSTKEVGCDISSDTAKVNTRILDYYNANNNDASRIKMYNGSNDWWFLRSVYSSFDNHFYYVYNSGYSTYGSANTTKGVAPAFRIGKKE